VQNTPIRYLLDYRIIAYPAFPKYVTIVGTDGLVSPPPVPLVYCLFICPRLLVDPIGGPLPLVLGYVPRAIQLCEGYIYTKVQG
jgi:hypothetical protein